MQRKQGYCSYCRVQYPNLEQHLFSSQHRSLTRQNRRQICNSSLMERFLQDVLRHHPYNYQENRSPNETPSDATSPDVVCMDEFFPEETSEESSETSESEESSETSESGEELCCGPSKHQEHAQEVSVRPSVIQKLEKGQQRSLQFVHKIESGMRKVNPVDVGQATNNGKNLIRPPVICNAPASHLSASSYDRPVTTTRLPLAASLDSVSKYDPNKIGKHFEQLDIVSRNPVPSSCLETSPVSHKNLKESNRKYLHVNSDKLVLQKDVKSQGAALSPDSKFRELKGTENSVRVKSSKLAVNPAVNLNKTGKPSDKGTFEDAIPKRHREDLSNVDCTQEEHLLFKKSSFLEQKCSASSEVEFDYGPLQSASDQSQESIQEFNLWKEEQVDQEDGSDKSGGSGMSFNCDSSCHSLTDQSEVSDREITLLEEIHADLEYKNNKSCVSEVSSDCNDSLQAVSNQSQVNVKETGLQNKVRISLVDQCYETSGSEMNSDCEDDLPQSANDYRHRQQPAKEVSFPQGVRIDLVDRDYGSGSSEASANSVCSLEPVDEEPPVVVTEMKLGKKARVKLVESSYGSSYSESSSDSDVPLQSVVDQHQVTVKERKPKDRHVHVKQKKRKSSRAKACPHCDVSHETVADEPQRAVEGKNLLKEKNADLVDMNCESHDPEMGFHADAQLVADRSQVAVKEVNPQKVDIDLENKSVQSSISYLSFDSHAFLYQSANDQPQGALGEINLKELNVDMEVKSSGCSSSELTFDSDSPLLSVTERFQLDVERINEDDFNLEDESCESSSSDLTFDSDIHDFSVVDQPEVAVYEEEPVDLENKSNESCISEITFDSDIPLHSGNDQPEVAVKEVIIQEEEYVLLERKNDKPSGSEISLDSYAPLHSLTNSLEVADKKLNSHKEEQVHLKNKKSVPTYSELNLAYDTSFHSMTEHTEDPIKDKNFQKEEHVQLENKNNELSVSKTRLDSGIPLQSMIHKPEVVVKNIWLQKEKHAEFQGKNAEFGDSVIHSDCDIPHYPMIETQVPFKKRETKKHILEKKNDKHGGSELILSSAILPQSMTEKPQLAVLKKDHVDPADDSTEIRGFEINLNIDSSLHSVTDQPHMAPLKEKHVDLKDKNSKLNDSKISFTFVGPSQTEHHKTVKETNLWKKEATGLENKIDEPYGSKVIHDTDVSIQSAANEPEVAIQQRNLEDEEQMYLDIENYQHSTYSDCFVQAVVDRPQITILGPEHIEIEGKHNQSCDSELSFDSDDSLLLLSEKLRELSLGKDEDVDMDEKRDEAESFKIVCDSDVLQPVASQTEEVVEKSNFWKKHIDMEDKIVRPSNSKIHFYSDELHQSVTNKIQEPFEEINSSREGHVCVDDKGYEPNGSKIIYVSNIPFQSVIQPPQMLGEEHSNLEVKSSGPCGPKISFDSSDSCQSVAGQLQEAVQEINLKEDHIYLEDKSYKLVDCETCYDSNVPVQFVADQSHVSAKEISLQKKDNNDLENNCTPYSEIRCDSNVHLQSDIDPSHNDLENNCTPYSEIRCDSNVHLQSDVDPPHNDLENNYSSYSEITCDSDVHLQSEVDQPHNDLENSYIPYSELRCDSDVPQQSDIDPSHSDLENNYTPYSEIRCDSDVHLQSDVDPSHNDLENNYTHYSEIRCDSDVHLQSEVDPSHSNLENNYTPYSEIRCDSDPRLQSEVDPSHNDLENNYTPYSEIRCDSDVRLQSEVDQPHDDLENNYTHYSEIRCDSDAHLQSEVDQPHDDLENNYTPYSEIRRDSDVRLQSEVDQPHNDVENNYTPYSKIRCVSDIRLQSEVDQPHDDLENNYTHYSEIRCDSDPRLQPEVDQPHNDVENNYTHYSEIRCDSDPRLQPEVDQPHNDVENNYTPYSKIRCVSDIRLQSEVDQPHDDLENNYTHYSEIRCDSDPRLQSEVDQPHNDVENNYTHYSEIRCDSDAHLQSEVDQPHDDLENNYTHYSEIRCDSDVRLQSEVDQPHDDLENNYTHYSEIRYDSDPRLQSEVDQPHNDVENNYTHYSEIRCDSDARLQSEVDQPHDDLENNYTHYSDIRCDSDPRLQSEVDQPHDDLENNYTHYSDIRCDSDPRLQSEVDQPHDDLENNYARYSEIRYDSDVRLQSEVDQPHNNLENNYIPYSEIRYDSDVRLQSEVDQPHNDLENNYTRYSEIRYDSDVRLQSEVDQPHDDLENNYTHYSEIRYDSDVRLQSEVDQPHNDVGNNYTHYSEIRYDSDVRLQSEVDQPHNDVGNNYIPYSEIRYDSDVRLQSEVDQPYNDVGNNYTHYSEIRYDSDVHLQSEVDQPHNDVGNNYIPYSEIRYDSDVHLQSEVDPPQVTCKGTNLQKRELGMEEKSSEHSDSEMMYDSDVSFQILVNPSQMSDGESDSPEVVFVDVMASDSDCDHEVISDPNIPLELVSDPSQMSSQETSCINAEYVETENNYCSFCGSEVRNVSDDPSRPVRNHPKESFKIINRKNDYIILGDSTCQCCGYEIDFNVDTSDQSMTYQSQGPDKICIDSEDRSCEFNDSGRNFNLEETSQSVIYELQKIDKEVNPRNDANNIGLKDKNGEPSVSSVNCAAPSTSVVHHVAGIKGILKHTERSTSSSEMDFQRDPSVTNQPQEAVNKKRRPKKVTFDLREYHDTQSRSVPMDDSVRNVEKAKEIIEDVPDEPVLEALPNAPPSLEGKAGSQVLRENEINSLEKEFKEGHNCDLDGDSKTKKVVSNEEEKVILYYTNQTTVAIQTSPGRTADGTPLVGEYSVALEKSCCHYALSDRLFDKKNCNVASQSQLEKVSHGTQTNFITYPLKKRKIFIPEEESPKKNCSESDEKEKKKAKIGTVEDPVSQTNSSEPAQSKSSVHVLSSGNLKPKEGESCNLTKMNPSTSDNEKQLKCKEKQRKHNDPSKIVNNPSVKLRVPQSSVWKRGNIHHSGNGAIPSARENDTIQNLPSTSTMTVAGRYELRSRSRTSESSTFLENSKAVNVSEIPEDNFQLTLVNRDVARKSPKSVRNEILKSKGKKNIQRRNVTASSHSSFSQKAYKAVILQQKTIIASEKWSIWIQNKANDIIRKYISKYSIFLRRRYQSRTTFFGMHSKKKYVASRLEEVERSTQMFLNTSVPPAGAKEQLRAITSPLKQPVQRSSRAAGRQKPKRKYCRRKKKRPIPVREYDLRSSCYIPDSDRMMTRLASKLRNNEVK